MTDFTKLPDKLRALNEEYALNTLGKKEPLIEEAAEAIQHLLHANAFLAKHLQQSAYDYKDQMLSDG